MDGRRMIWNVTATVKLVMIVKNDLKSKQIMIMSGTVMNNEIKQKGFIMDSIQELIPYLQNLIEKNNCAISVSKINNEFVVSVIGRFRTRIFKDTDSRKLITNIKQHIQV